MLREQTSNFGSLLLDDCLFNSPRLLLLHSASREKSVSDVSTWNFAMQRSGKVLSPLIMLGGFARTLDDARWTKDIHSIFNRV